MNELTVYNNFPTGNELQALNMIALAASKSNLYKQTPEAILMVLLSARELNIGPMMALNGGIWNIQGKTEISARLMMALIRRGGHSITIDSSSTSCTIKGKRKDNGDTAEVTFTLEDARKADLLKSQTWTKYAEDMLYARAMSRLARRLFPDVIGNCYVEGEVDTKKEFDPRGLEQAEVVQEKTQEQINELERVSNELLKVQKEKLLGKFLPDHQSFVVEYLTNWCKATNKSETQAYAHFLQEAGIKALNEKILAYEESQNPKKSANE